MKKRKRVYRVEFDAIETPTEFGDFEGDRNMIRYLKSNAKEMNDHYLEIKNLKIRRVKACARK